MNDICNLTFPNHFFEDEVRDGFLVPGMMKRYWAGNLKVLSVIASICKKHDIPWFVICGTLLGCIRHGGYVPWDDDLDIVMMRDDLQRFFAVAKNELPEPYVLLNVQDNYKAENSIARIINWKELTGGIVREFYGCPYSSGVDLFALDGRYPDETQEAARRKRFHDVVVALTHISMRTTQAEKYRALIRKIEKENHCSIKQDDVVNGRLYALINRIYREVPLEESAECELFHGLEDHLVFRKEWFRDAVWMPFEGFLVPVPAGYEQVLRVNYGDFMRLGRRGSAHEYPAYGKQELVMRDMMGHNPFRYTYEPEHLKKTRGASVRERADEMVRMLTEAERKAAELENAGDAGSAAQLREGCRALIRALAGMLGLSPDETILTEDLIREVNKQRVLFLAVRPSWWKTLAPYYESEKAQENTEVMLSCLPWYEQAEDLSRGQKHDDRDGFAPELSVVSADDLNMKNLLWDAIYFQFPYDGTNQAITIDRTFYASSLKDCTDCLIYVPCYDVPMPDENDAQGRCSFRYLIEQPAVVYADVVCVANESIRQMYIDVMTDIAGKETRSVWEGKILSGEAADCDA